MKNKPTKDTIRMPNKKELNDLAEYWLSVEKQYSKHDVREFMEHDFFVILEDYGTCYEDFRGRRVMIRVDGNDPSLVETYIWDSDGKVVPALDNWYLINCEQKEIR